MPVDIRNRTAAPARGAPGNIDTLFVPIAAAGGAFPVGQVVTLRSITDYEAAGGARNDATVVYDGLDTFFREGGRQAHAVRYDTDALAPVVNTLALALALFTENYGGGQVVGWGLAPDAVLYGTLQGWAANNKRYALLDVAVADDTVAELNAKAALVPAQNASYGALFGPWVTIPGQAGVIGAAARQAPATAVVAALIARADALGNPNRAPAGRDFPLQYATGFVSAQLSDADAVAMRNAGINPLREKFGLLVLDGFQTSIDQTPDSPFWQANCGRARMWLQWQAMAAGLNYEYKPLDGRGRLAGRFKSDLDVICLDLWRADGLFGDSPQEAFAVNVGVSVNTATTQALGELHATVEAKFSLHARDVVVDLVSVPVTGRVSSAA